MASDLDEATAWFDQFPDAPGWEHDQWCARHWAPCPILGANGIGAATELMQIFVNEIATGRTPAALNAQMQAAGRICCTLGDARMHEIWGHWPPTPKDPGEVIDDAA
jgi:hypothetical protein